MGIWTWIVGIIAGVAVVAFLANGDGDRTFGGRERQLFGDRAAQALEAVPVAVGAEEALPIVRSLNPPPADAAPTLDEVQQLLTTASTQSPDDAKATLQQAQDKLDTAIDTVRDDADDTSNDVERLRLLRFAAVLTKIQDAIQSRQDQQQ